MDKGQLVPDEVVQGIMPVPSMQTYMPMAFCLMAFPGPLCRLKSLTKIERKGERDITCPCIKCWWEELVKRLVNRGKTSGRTDDNEEVIRARITEYENKTAPVAGHYQKLGKVVPVKGEGSVDDIFRALTNQIEAIKEKEHRVRQK